MLHILALAVLLAAIVVAGFICRACLIANVGIIYLKAKFTCM